VHPIFGKQLNIREGGFAVPCRTAAIGQLNVVRSRWGRPVRGPGNCRRCTAPCASHSFMKVKGAAGPFVLSVILVGEVGN